MIAPRRPCLFKPLLTIVLAGCSSLLVPLSDSSRGEEARESVRVLSFNLWQGGDGGKQPLDRTVEVVKASRADIVGFQETGGVAPKGAPRPDHAAEIARRLGWNYVDQGGRTGIISRFEIVAPTPKKWGVKLALPSGRLMYAFNVHLPASPYQPYQLLRIPYGNDPFLATEAEAIQAAREARGRQVAEMLEEAKSIAGEGLPMVLTGDFNEPSHRDWTEEAAKAALCPVKVEWPSTRAVEEAGFLDSYRIVHPDPLKSRGLTWTPTTRADDPKDKHDRIDFVFVRGLENPKAVVKSAELVGEASEAADLVVSPYPSDHRAVVVELDLSAGGPKATGR